MSEPTEGNAPKRPRWCCLGGYALAAGSALRGAGPLLPLSHLAELADCLHSEDLLEDRQPFSLTPAKVSPIKA